MTIKEFDAGISKTIGALFPFGLKFTKEARETYYEELKKIDSSQWNYIVTKIIQTWNIHDYGKINKFPPVFTFLELYDPSKNKPRQSIRCDKCSNTGLIGMVHPHNNAIYSHRCNCGISRNTRIPTEKIGFANGFKLDWQYMV